MTTKTQTTTKCDSNFPQCRNNAKVHFPASAFTAELNLCKRHAAKFTAEAESFHSRNA